MSACVVWPRRARFGSRPIGSWPLPATLGLWETKDRSGRVIPLRSSAGLPTIGFNMIGMTQQARQAVLEVMVSARDVHVKLPAEHILNVARPKVQGDAGRAVIDLLLTIRDEAVLVNDRDRNSSRVVRDDPHRVAQTAGGTLAA